MLWFAKKDDIVICHKTFSRKALEKLDLMRLNSRSLKPKAEAIEEVLEKKIKSKKKQLCLTQIMYALIAKKYSIKSIAAD